MRISQLRAPTKPDPEADQGEHRFAYRLWPHVDPAGHSITAHDIARQAYCFNDPPLVVAGGGAAGTPPPPLVVGSPNLIIETIKRAEDGNGVIVRYYECNRRRGPVTLQAGFPLQSATLTNLLEDALEPLVVEGSTVQLYVKPFQIGTVRLVPQ
jgi:alpha-mannosidase